MEFSVSVGKPYSGPFTCGIIPRSGDDIVKGVGDWKGTISTKSKASPVDDAIEVCRVPKTPLSNRPEIALAEIQLAVFQAHLQILRGGRTMEALADDMGMTEGDCTYYLGNVAKCDIPTLMKLLTALGLTFSITADTV